MKPMIMRFQSICSKPHQGGGMCGKAQTSKKNSNFSSLGGLAGKNSKMFLTRTSLVLLKCPYSHRNIQILAKMYKFLAKMCQFLAMARKMSF